MITIEPAECWEYFEANIEELREFPEVIAENPLSGVEIELDVDLDSPMFRVIEDGADIYTEVCLSKSDVEETLGRLYDEYLDGFPAGDFVSSGWSLEDFEAADILDRQEQLEDAVSDMLLVFASNLVELCPDPHELQKMMEFLVNFVGAYLYDEYGVSIYRPMYVENDEGKKEFKEFPYPLIFK